MELYLSQNKSYLVIQPSLSFSISVWNSAWCFSFFLLFLSVEYWFAIVLFTFQDRLDDYDSVCVVLGNEACDLDSAVSALVYAQFLTHCKKYGADTPHIPVLNIPREDYPLKTEVVHFLAKLGISSDHIVFRYAIGSSVDTEALIFLDFFPFFLIFFWSIRNDINLLSLKMKKKLKLVLVDHNILNSLDYNLDSSVVEIIDHHQLEHPPSDKITMVVEPVGSCCTLVSSLILKQVPDFLKADSATLLMGKNILPPRY